MAMSAGQSAVPTQARTRIAFLTLVIAAFVIGSATGGLVTLSASTAVDEEQAAVASDTGAACDSTEFSNYRRLLGNMRAAADRHDIRAYVGFRNDLAALIRAVGPEGSVQLVGAIEFGCWD
jgi:hypothetical protein